MSGEHYAEQLMIDYLGYLDLFAADRVAIDNVPFTPSVEWDYWARVDFIPTGTNPSTLTKRSADAIMQIMVFVQANSGACEVKELADQIVDHFGMERTIENSGFDIHINKSVRGQGMNTTQYGADWYVIPVSVYYTVFLQTH